MKQTIVKISLHLTSAVVGFVIAVILFNKDRDLSFLNRYLIDYSARSATLSYLESSHPEDANWHLKQTKCDLLGLIYDYKNILHKADPDFLYILKMNVTNSKSDCEFHQKLNEYFEKSEI